MKNQAATTLIVMPAMNEGKTIKKVLTSLKRTCDFDVLVVDDGSSDDTVQVAKQCDCFVVSHSSNLGAWKATQTGIRFAIRNGYKVVVTMDADGQHRAEDVAKLIRKKQEGYDFVIGSCVQRGSKLRKFAWRFFRTISGLDIKDLTSGFRVYGHTLLVALSGKRVTMLQYQDMGVLFLVKLFNLRYAEVNVEMEQRNDGVSRIFNSWVAVLQYLQYTLILTVAKSRLFLNRKYRLKLLEEGKVD